MNPLKTVPIILCCILCSHTFAQDLDKELSNLAEKLATPIKEQAKKKVTVLDFTDLQGNPSGELGKYIAEQLTINLVMTKRDFSVLDRANLKKILAEHKLTATGLVDPENAKKLGQFAGVDAIILGTIIPKSQTISLTAKIITTDTAEIIGAARAEFKSDDTVKQLVSTPATVEDTTTLNQGPSDSPAPPARKPFGDLQVNVESLKRLPDEDGGRYGAVRLTLIIANTSESKTYGVAMEYDPYYRFILNNSRGDQFKVAQVTGIESGSISDGSFSGSMTDIPPKSSITIVAKGAAQWDGKPGDYRPYRLQAIVMFGIENNGRYPDARKFNLVMDIK